MLEKFDRVANILTDNEKNLKETIDRLGPFANTLGEAVASGPNFDSLVGLNTFGDYTAIFLNALRGRYPQVWQSLMYSAFPLIPDNYKLGPPDNTDTPRGPLPSPDLSQTGTDHERRTVTMTIGRKVLLGVLAVVLAIALVVVGWTVFLKSTTNTFTAYFGSVASLYEGDPVRVLGVNVGSVSKITPRENDVKVELRVDKSIDIPPQDAKAVIVAQSLVSGRFVQLTPPVYSGGPTMPDGHDIPMDRTAVPMEWDDIKAQLTKLTEAIGPEGPDQARRPRRSTSSTRTSRATVPRSTSRSVRCPM